VLQVVFPYNNIAATEGIKEDVNADYDNTRVQLDFIHHRMAMTSLVREPRAINPEMPFAARDFAGRWQFVMDNLTCGTVTVADQITGLPVTMPIAVNNELRNQGKFVTSFGGAIQAKYPELEEGFISLRGPACIVDIAECAADPGYPAQNYESANTPCPTSAVVITEVPTINPNTNTYEVALNSILCNGMEIIHPAITGTANLTDLVTQMNSLLSAMGTWSVSGSAIALSGPNCTTISIPWVA
jgi:hypothetical protein